MVAGAAPPGLRGFSEEPERPTEASPGRHSGGGGACRVPNISGTTFKKGRSYGTMFLKSGFVELEKDGGVEQPAQRREAELEKRQR